MANGRPSQNRWLALTGVGLGVLMATIDMSIVNIALPTLVTELHTSFAMVQWVVLAYTLVITSLVLGAARLGDMIGQKGVYFAGLIIFTLGSLLCGLAPSIGWLIGFRAFQGLGAVMMQSLGVAIVTIIFPPNERGKALGIIGGIVAIGLALGPPLGGILIGFTGWRSIFLVNVPLGLLAGIMIIMVLPKLQPLQKGQRFDTMGAMVLFVTLACYALGMTLGQRWGFGTLSVLLLLAVSGAGLLSFVFMEKRIREPMMDLSLFGNVVFSLNLLTGFLVFVVLGGLFVLPFFLELVKGYSTEQTGLLMMVVPVAMGLISPWAGALSDRYGSQGINFMGLSVLVVGCFALSTLDTDVNMSGCIIRLAPVGIGLGLFQSPNNSAVMGAAPRNRLGVASGLLSLSRTLGNTSGLPLMGAVFTAHVLSLAGLSSQAGIETAPPEALVAGVEGTYLIAACIALAALCLSACALWSDKKRKKGL